MTTKISWYMLEHGVALGDSTWSDQIKITDIQPGAPDEIKFSCRPGPKLNQWRRVQVESPNLSHAATRDMFAGIPPYGQPDGVQTFFTIPADRDDFGNAKLQFVRPVLLGFQEIFYEIDDLFRYKGFQVEITWMDGNPYRDWQHPPPGPSEKFIPTQGGWRNCTKCKSLISTASRGRCPAGDYHSPQKPALVWHPIYSGPWISEGEEWAHCAKCAGLFPFQPSPASNFCPAGGVHESNQSQHFTLQVNNPTATGKRYFYRCGRCSTLFYSEDGEQNGVCVAGGAHNKISSGVYTLRFDARDLGF